MINKFINKWLDNNIKIFIDGKYIGFEIYYMYDIDMKYTLLVFIGNTDIIRISTMKINGNYIGLIDIYTYDINNNEIHIIDDNDIVKYTWNPPGIYNKIKEYIDNNKDFIKILMIMRKYILDEE